MVTAHENAQPQILVPPKIAPQTMRLSQVHIKGPGDDGLDALIRRQTAQKPDEKRKVKVVGENKFGNLLRRYELFLGRKNYFIKNKEILDGIEDVLTVEDINAFLQLTVGFEDYEKDYSRGTSRFINRLIQNSYNAGYNNFVLNTIVLSKKLDHFGENFCGLPYRMISVQIDGDIGVNCGMNAFCSSFTINGNANSCCGYKIYNSIITVKGDVGNWFGFGAKYSSFTINEGVNTDNYTDDTIGCTFKTQNPKTLDKLLEYFQKNKSHKFYLIHPDGTEELKRAD
ncbi:hypothetical protein HY636_03335 [Candidatus Woesearchaeota archaeon]|nr:hypothetical protein [Candidatus Woesearchaeota archaeon]